ncbi:MAG TPA: carboxypeptidase-like regulatory domain-containing protein [Solirubrobacteraceae bacterium]|jgi:hypothetical protein
MTLAALGALALLLTPATSRAVAATHNASISGVVTNAVTQLPLAGIEVFAYSRKASFSEKEALELGAGSSGVGRTNGEGRYTIPSLNGEAFEVVFAVPEESTLNFVPQLYPGRSIFGEGTPVALASGEARAGVDAALEPGGAISGTVLAAQGASPIQAAVACAFGPPGVRPPAQGGCTSTGVAGTYVLRGLPVGEYRVFFLAESFAAQFFDHVATEAAARAVSVAVGATTPDIDAALELPPENEPSDEETLLGTLSGQLGAPLPTGGGGPLGGSTTSVPSRLRLRGTRIAVTKAGIAEVRLECGVGAGCHDSLTLTTSVKTGSGRRHSTTVAGAHLSMKPVSELTVRLILDASARRHLRAAHGSLAAMLKLTPAISVQPAAITVTPVRLVRQHQST